MTTETTKPSRTSETPVLISGAGPVGTLAAIMLTRLGIPCRLIERELEVSPMSKALSLHARTLEIMDQTGLIDRFLAQGHPLSIFNVYFNGVHSVFPGLANSISHYNYALFQEQAKTTAILNGELEAHGGKVDRGWELMDTKVIEDQASGQTWVETIIRRALDGSNIRSTESKVLGEIELDAEQAGKKYEIEVVRSQYLIAADGGKSVVRHKLSIPFPGRTLENNIILFDGDIETDLELGDITVINGKNNQTMNIFPLSTGNVRIMVDASHLDRTKRPTNEDLEKIAQATADPYKFKIKGSSWLTFYRVNERQAASYSYKNRIFLAGDAAHVHSPAGGQGMNLGLQDAYNLTWKLALVLNKLSTPKILETYGEERIPVARDVINMSSRMFATGFSQKLYHRIIRKSVTTFASFLLRFIAVPAATVSMLSIRYNENAINQPHKTQRKPAEEYQVGQRAHDGPLLRVLPGGQTSQETVRLHQLIHGPGTFHILVFTSDMLRTTASTSKQADHQGIAFTTESQLRKNLEYYLREWASKWAYGAVHFSTSSQTELTERQTKSKRPMFNVHVISALAETISGPDFKDPSKIRADSLANKEPGKGRLYFDHLRIVHERYGVPVKTGSGAIVVIRPDSHVGYRVLGTNESAWMDVDQYLKSIFDACP
ncbi:hypothetical protein BX616_009905 [Lobosporangium transversale]|uniref:FAD binding domain-domain-containing protein n=1 Tax=Lobosporangium transversale TaxID=64571 RepID=A0A1Y2GR61_9FUNG|nr:FAD binding domain-domain-containing protein [Lobosporangium transversale]KAF9913532.1 hypothetical protein BX616_009905 [Lobosporangium transversale]ORZ18336.1 FAD binding domain-domain-containing protein [Lobosporangium transversale]|eukprot:XP_021882131.1 FAD binding domain-domain-containing protein [Lobosporangium transversale]